MPFERNEELCQCRWNGVSVRDVIEHARSYVSADCPQSRIDATRQCRSQELLAETIFSHEGRDLQTKNAHSTFVTRLDHQAPDLDWAASGRIADP